MRNDRLIRLKHLYYQTSSTGEELRELSALLREFYPWACARMLGLQLEAYDRGTETAQEKAHLEEMEAATSPRIVS